MLTRPIEMFAVSGTGLLGTILTSSDFASSALSTNRIVNSVRDIDQEGETFSPMFRVFLRSLAQPEKPDRSHMLLIDRDVEFIGVYVSANVFKLEIGSIGRRCFGSCRQAHADLLLDL